MQEKQRSRRTAGRETLVQAAARSMCAPLQHCSAFMPASLTTPAIPQRTSPAPSSGTTGEAAAACLPACLRHDTALMRTNTVCSLISQLPLVNSGCWPEAPSACGDAGRTWGLACAPCVYMEACGWCTMHCFEGHRCTLKTVVICVSDPGVLLLESKVSVSDNVGQGCCSSTCPTSSRRR